MSRWSYKQIGHIWGIHPKKAPQAFRPWMDKAVKLWRADPTTFMEMLLAASESTMFPSELDLRQRLNEGQANRTELVQPRKTVRNREPIMSENHR